MIPDIPDLDPAQPWWVWPLQILAWIAAIGVLTVVTWLMQRPIKRELRDTKAAAEATKSQTVNSHEGAEYPNLREELTAMRTSQDKTLSQIRSELGGIREDAARDRQANHETLMQAMTQQVPALISAAIAEHASTTKH